MRGLANLWAIVEFLREECEGIDAQYCRDAIELRGCVPVQTDGINNFNIVHLNIRSLNKNYDELLLLLNSMNLNTILVIILSEVWNITDLSNYDIPGYSTYYDGGSFNQNDGVVIYVKDNYTYNIKTHNFTQTSYSSLTIKIADQKIGVLAIYRPPSTDTQTFISELDNMLKINNNNDINIMIGDINLNILNKISTNVNDYLNVLEGKGYEPYINKPTRVTRTSKTCIDHIFVKTKPKHKRNIKSYIIQTDITDHYCVLLNIRTSKLQKIANNKHTLKKI